MEYLNHSDYLKLSKAKQKEHDRLYSEACLKDIKSGTTIYTMVKHVSSSGMSRDIALYYVSEERICDISYHVAHVLGNQRAKNGGVKISGCGMDMGFSLVYDLSCTLFQGQDRAGYILKHEWL
jgi:hypothetical protein